MERYYGTYSNITERIIMKPEDRKDNHQQQRQDQRPGQNQQPGHDKNRQQDQYNKNKQPGQQHQEKPWDKK